MLIVDEEDVATMAVFGVHVRGADGGHRYARSATARSKTTRAGRGDRHLHAGRHGEPHEQLHEQLAQPARRAERWGRRRVHRPRPVTVARPVIVVTPATMAAIVCPGALATIVHPTSLGGQ